MLLVILPSLAVQEDALTGDVFTIIALGSVMVATVVFVMPFESLTVTV